MSNEFILLGHILWVSGLAFACRKQPAETQIILMVLYSVLGNVMVFKQMILFPNVPKLTMIVNTADAYAVGVILVLNYIRERYDDEVVYRAMKLSFLSLAVLAVAAYFQVNYGGIDDSMTRSYDLIMIEFPGLVMKSAVIYIVVQYLDNKLFSWMRKQCGQQYLVGRMVLSLLFSQWLDTLLFSFIAYGHVAYSIWNVVLFSGTVKSVCALLVTFNTAIGHYIWGKEHV